MFRKVLNIIVTVIAVLSIFLAGFSLWTVATTDSGKVPSVFGFSILRVVSLSMEPTLPEGSIVFVIKTDTSELTEGDIISFYSNDPSIKGKVNTHRIYEVNTDAGAENYIFITKGDNEETNPIPDKYPVPPENVIGKVVGKSAFLGAFVSLLSGKYSFVFLIILPLLLIVAVNIRNVIKLIKKEADAEAEKYVKEKLGSKNSDNGALPEIPPDKDAATKPDTAKPDDTKPDDDKKQ